MRFALALLLGLALPAAAQTLTCTAGSAVTLTCAASPPTQPPPACAPVASPSTFASSEAPTTVTFTANCTGPYQWGNAPNAPPVTGSGAAVTTVFGPGTPAGTYGYTVNGAPVVVTVTPSQQAASCNLTGEFQAAGQWKDFTLSAGGFASFRLPAVTQSGRNAEMIAVQTVNTPGDLLSEIAISDTCGSFDVPPLCKMTGSSWSMNLHAFSSPNTGFCTLTPGRTYYANVRNRVNGVETCVGNCEQRLSYVGNLR